MGKAAERLTVQDAARAYAKSVGRMIGGQITADEHRAENRALRAQLSEVEWEQAKATAIGAWQRAGGE